MIVNVRQLREGHNPVSVKVSAARLTEFVQSVDELYGTCEQGAVAELDLLRTGKMVQVRGTIDAALRFSCARCLEVFEAPFQVELDWTLLPKSVLDRDTKAREDDGLELAREDLDVSFLESNEVDLVDLIRETFLLELDPCPTCSVDKCPGLEYIAPPSADESSAEDPEQQRIDPRWAPLLALKDKLKDDGR